VVFGDCFDLEARVFGSVTLVGKGELLVLPLGGVLFFIASEHSSFKLELEPWRLVLLFWGVVVMGEVVGVLRLLLRVGVLTVSVELEVLESAPFSLSFELSDVDDLVLEIVLRVFGGGSGSGEEIFLLLRLVCGTGDFCLLRVFLPIFNYKYIKFNYKKNQ